ncbi:MULTISPECIES: peptidase domain-containing ABC transporter [unclassified Iodidimonas]|jgi:ATP-binding cassette subfamily C protein/ATP-binding cassette subfamily C protein LapB|uniref:peptidase domain-containing ABC transporter n=1 Tax=unclassified Iodidimonas TaxID=2626145 RepID=UPI002482FFC7|nr:MULTISPECIES: peptidase domain-containing ABC transporter [unclassified Iodidimonas]
MNAPAPPRGSEQGSQRPHTALSHQDADALASAIRRGSLGDFTARSGFAACLMALLDARGWRGTQRSLSEALPHFASDLNLASLRNVLADLNFKTIERPIKKGEVLDPRLMPCLYLDDQGNPSALSVNEQGIFEIFAGDDNVWRTLDKPLGAGLVILITEIPTDQDAPRPEHNWTRAILRRMRPRIMRLLGMTFLLNLLALVGPLFIMVVYDQVVASGSPRLLVPLVIGVGLAALIELITRIFRGKSIAFMSGRLEFIISRSVFRQILSLPITRTESAPLSGQISRIREFDSMRDIFMGSLVTVLLELPFIGVFLLVIALLAGWLVLIPFVMIGVFILMGAIALPSLKRSVARTSNQRSRQYRFLIEFVTNLRTIREAGAGERWADRYRELSATTSLEQFRNGQIAFTLQSLSQLIMMIAGGGTIVYGVILVIGGTLTAGGLIAVMALVWRILAPIQNLFLTLTRAEQISMTVGHLDQLMQLRGEQTRHHSGGIIRQWAGAIDFTRVSFRYRPNTDPALLGISFKADPGEMIAIMGSNGSGKSTILRLIAGLYEAQAGQVSIDGLDVRQIDPQELRQQIAYVPQNCHVFHGTLAQNLRFSNPVVSEREIEDACRKAGLWDEITRLPDGLETRFGDQTVWQLNAGFRQRISLARAYLRDAQLILLDEPAQALDDEGDQALVQMIQNLRGEKTIIMVSHRPSHIRLADRVLHLEKGILIAEGAPEQSLSRSEGKFL